MIKYLVLILFFTQFTSAISQESREIDSLKSELKKAKNNQKIDIYYHLGKMYTIQLHMIDSALSFIDKGIVLSEKLNHIEKMCKGYQYKARVLTEINRDSAIALYNKAANVAQKYNLKRIQMVALYNVAKNYSIIRDYQKILYFIEQVEKLAEELNDKKYLSYIYNLYGGYYKETDYHKALEYYFKSLELKQDTLDNGRQVASIKSISNSINNIGYIFYALNDFEKAMEYYQKCLELRKVIGYDKGLSTVLLKIGHIYKKKKQYTEAITHYNEALHYSTKHNDRLTTSLIYPALASIYLIKDDLQKSIELYEKSIKLTDELGISLNNVESHMNLARAYIKRKDFTKALKHIDLAFELLNSNKDHRVDKYKSLHLVLSWAYEGMGNYKKALEVLKEYNVLKDTLFNEELSAQVAEMEVKYQTQKKEKEIAEQTLVIEQQKSDLRMQWIIIGSIIALVIIFGLLLFFLFYRYRSKQKQKQTELEKRSIEIEQRLLHTQMNPHFIFNSMASVQNFISADDKKAAMSFISKFASLIRNVLQNSRETTIPLQEEIDTLTLYMGLEKLRLENSFDYKINASEELDSENIFVPPMLVQPFIENAIKHGLQDKKDKGILELHFKKNASVIYCTIRDNGIGREKARLNQQSSHRSLALDIIRERLDILKNIYHMDLYYVIRDIKANGRTGGTEVMITLPFETE